MATCKNCGHNYGDHLWLDHCPCLKVLDDATHETCTCAEFIPDMEELNE